MIEKIPISYKLSAEQIEELKAKKKKNNIK